MRILITGCAGFIGSHLCERLIQDGHQIIGIDNFDPFYGKNIKMQNIQQLLKAPAFTFRELDLRSASQVHSITEAFDMVIHLAAKAGVRPSIEAPVDYIETNITGTQNLVNLMLQKGIRKLVFASSSSVYGDKLVPPYAEDAIVDYPISTYAFTKKSCELMLYTYFHLYKLSSLSLRFFTVYGPRQRPDLAINKFFAAIERGEAIQVFGDGSTARDYTFIDDIVSGIIKAVEFLQKNGETYEIINLGNNKPTVLLDLIRHIEQVVGRTALIQFREMQPGDVRMTCADTRKASRLLGYAPQSAIQDGLRAYYQWLQKFGQQQVSNNKTITQQ